MTLLGTYSSIVKPNTNSPTARTSCQQFFWFKHHSPTTPYREPNGTSNLRIIKFNGGPDGLGNPSHDEWWFADEHMWMLTPEGQNPYLHIGSGSHWLNFHAVGGDVGWTAPWGVSPILFSLRSSGGVQQHMLELPHNGTGSDNGTGPKAYALPNVPFGVWISFIVHVIFGRSFHDNVAAGTRLGRVQVWVNAADGSIVSPADGSPTVDTGAAGVNTMIRDTTNGINQQYISLWEGQYNPAGFANVTNPFPNQTGFCTTCAGSGGCVNGLLDRHFYYKHVACRVGKTLSECLADTSITLTSTSEHSTYFAAATPNYGDSVYTLLTGSQQRDSSNLIVPPALGGAPTVPVITSFAPTSGTAGVTSVVITGSNFTGATAVSFNGVTAPGFVVNSATQITVTCPAGATTGAIQVTTPQGFGRSTDDFTVGATPPPTLPDPAANHLRVGNSSIGAYNTATVTDSKRVLKRNIGVGNTVTIDKAYFLTAGPTSIGSEPLRVIVYDDDGIGNLPGTLLGSSDPVTVAQGAAASYVEFSFTAPVVAPGGSTGDIYIGIHFGTPGSANYSYTSVTGEGWKLADTFSDGPSNPFGANPIVINTEIALVVDYLTTADTVAPLLTLASGGGPDLSLQYDEALDPASIPSVSDFAVRVNGVGWGITGISLDPTDSRIMHVAISPAVDTNDIIALDYTQPASGAIQDVFGNKSASLVDLNVINITELPPGGFRVIDPAKRLAIARRIDPTDRRAGVGGGL